MSSDAIVDALVDVVKNGTLQTPHCLRGIVWAKRCLDKFPKAAIVVMGVADYHAYKERERQRQLELLLSDQAQMQRFQNALDYLRDEHIEYNWQTWEYARVMSAVMRTGQTAVSTRQPRGGA